MPTSGSRSKSRSARSKSSRSRSRSRSRSSVQPCSESLDELLNIFVKVGKDGINHPPSESEIAGHAEGICNMLNLFTMEDLVKLKKKNEQFFTFFQTAFVYLGQTSPTFVEVCKRKLKPAVNKLMNSSNHALENASQIGGAGGDEVPWFLKAKYVGYLVLVIWLLMSADAVMYPSSVGVLAVVKAYTMSLTGMDRLQGVMQRLMGNKEHEYPVAYAEGPGVNPMGVGTHAASRAALDLQAEAENNEEEIARLRRDAALAHVNAIAKMTAASVCAAAGTCESPAVTAIGLAVTPLVRAEEALPYLTDEEIKLNEELQKVSAELETEKRKYSIWDRNEVIIKELSERYVAIEAQIHALAKLKGIVPTLPKLNSAPHVLGNVSRNLLAQLTPSSGVLPARVMQLENKGPRHSPIVFEGEEKSPAFSLVKTGDSGENLQAEIPKAVAYSPAGRQSVSAMVEAGINPLEVSIGALAKKHPGEIVTLTDFQRLAGAAKTLTRAQMSVGTKTTYDPQAILALVDAALPEGVAKGPDYSRHLMVYMATEAAAKQAHQNAKIKRGVISAEMARVVDSALKDEITQIKDRLVTQVVELGFPGERDDAERVVRKAIDTSRLFGVMPNIKTTYYASSILQCNTGKCEMKPYSELRNQAELKRELEALPYAKRFMRVKYNILLSLIPLIGVGGLVIIIQALFRSLISIADIGTLCKRLVFGSDVKRKGVDALDAQRARQLLELEAAQHAARMKALEDERRPPPMGQRTSPNGKRIFFTKRASSRSRGTPAPAAPAPRRTRRAPRR